MKIFVDIDETICRTPQSRDYSEAAPIPSRIEKINKLYDQGNTIIYWTARGTETGIDWSEVTSKQFNDCGVKHTSLRFGKPYYDLFIDDKNVESSVYFEDEEAEKYEL